MASKHTILGPDGDTNSLILEDRKILILYGSETGNSQELAEDLERLAERLHFKATLDEMNEVEINVLAQYTLVVFVISTTGQGEIPKNARKFWKSLLRKKLPPTCLSPVQFTTFGLGDSSYARFNWAVRKLHKRLAQLGANEVYPRGEADERHDDGIDGGYLPWSFKIREYLLTTYPLPEGLSEIPSDVQLPPKVTLELVQNSDERNSQVASDGAIDTSDRSEVENELRGEHENPESRAFVAMLPEQAADLIKGGIAITDHPDETNDTTVQRDLEEKLDGPLPPSDLLPIPQSWTAEVAANSRITPNEHWQDVRHVQLQLLPNTASDGELVSCKYSVGEALVLYPKNYPEDAQALIEMMEWEDVAEKAMEFHARESHQLAFLPKNCYPLRRSTLRQLLLNNYDINAIPNRAFFHHIAFFATDEMQRERLQEFADPKYTDEFYDYTSRPRRSILEVLQEFSSVKIPYRWVPTIFPVIRGREYSIASGGNLKLDPTGHHVRIELLIALVKYKTVLRKTRQGLCSKYLETLQPGTRIQVTFSKNEGPPTSGPHMERPLLAIAPGTGVAPMRALIWDRVLDAKQRQQSGKNVLFFGGRSKKADFFFENEWLDMGVEVYTAFSRDQREKVYVQDILRREHVRVLELIKENAIICLCGSSGNMPQSVKAALQDIVIEGGLAVDKDEAQKYLNKENLFWEEVW